MIKNKKNEVCESGFSARNISANPHTPDDAIIGEDIYKICIKDTGNNSGRGSSSEQRAVQ